MLAREIIAFKNGRPSESSGTTIAESAAVSLSRPPRFQGKNPVISGKKLLTRNPAMQPAAPLTTEERSMVTFVPNGPASKP